MNLVLVAYTPSKMRAAIRFCETSFRHLGVRQRILVCNQKGLIGPSGVEGWTVVQGSNVFAEFSGWQEGLDRLRRLDDGQPVLFMNDTVNTHRHFSWFRRRALVVELSGAPSRSIVGFTNHAENDLGDVSIATLPLCGWVSSYCFLLGEHSLQKLDQRLYLDEVIDCCVQGGTDENTFFSEELSADLRTHLRWWLFGGGWYRSEPLCAANSAMFVAKARVICAELHLSARCWNLGLARRDPFERHPWSARADRGYQRAMSRLRIPLIEG